MELLLVRAYLGALYLQATHAQTFESEALEMCKDIADKSVILSEYFGAIERAPQPGFESHLKRQAHKLMREKLTRR